MTLELKKLATLGESPQDSQFEQAFSNLAHTYLKERVPKLLDYEVGFQLLDKNKDNTHAVGIMGFKVGPQWLYVPLFFLNGDIKGHEMLYLKNQDLLVPNTDRMVSFILGQYKPLLGESVTKELSQIGVVPPYFSQLTRSPTVTKFAAVKNWKPWVIEALPFIAKLAYTPVARETGLLKKYITETADQTIPYLWKKVAFIMPSFFYDLLEAEPAIKKMTIVIVKKKGDSSLISDTLSKLKGMLECGFCDNFEDGIITEDEEESEVEEPELEQKDNKKGKEKKKKKTEGKKEHQKKSSVLKDYINQELSKFKNVSVFSLQNSINSNSVISKEAAEVSLVEGDIVIRDNRPPQYRTKLVPVEALYSNYTKIRNPSESGIYDVLTRPHVVRKCAVVVHPYGPMGRLPGVLVIDVENGQWTYAQQQHVWVIKQYEKEEWRKFYESGKELTSLPHRGIFILYDQYGNSTTPMTYEYEDERDERKEHWTEIYDVMMVNTYIPHPAFTVQYPEDYLVDEKTHSYYVKGRTPARRAHLPPYTDAFRGDEKLNGYSSFAGYLKGTARILLSKSSHGKLRYTTEGMMVVPSYFRYKTLANKPLLRLGHSNDIYLGLLSHTEPLNVRYKESSYSINNGQWVNKFKAIKTLIEDIGLDKEEALKVINEVEKKGSYVARVKQGVFLSTTGPSAPSFPNVIPADDMMTGGMVNSISPMFATVAVPDLSSASYDRSMYDPRGPDPQLAMAAQQAKDYEMKEVFDVAALGALLKANNQNDIIDKYLYDIIKGMDRVGRILFLYYWHADKFQERYGLQNLADLEDAMRDVFERLGELVLDLKVKRLPNMESILSA